MPIRTTPLISGGYYHVINRGNASQPIFRKDHDYHRFVETLQHYQCSNPSPRFSHLQNLLPEIKEGILKKHKEGPKRVAIIAFCLMPNHFHFLLKQKEDQGIYNFVRQLANSYSRYFNTKYNRRGALFEGRFKAIKVETETQLLHLSRYIHLNPHSSHLIKNINQLFTYPYSSLPEYLRSADGGICQKEVILTHFLNTKDGYRKFVLDQADYQRSLKEIDHLCH